MNRRGFLLKSGVAGVTAGVTLTKSGDIPEHNWERYDWRSGPEVKDRLYQGPFPQYTPDAVIPGSEVIIVTTPLTDTVPNPGMACGYVSRYTGPPRSIAFCFQVAA